MGRNAGIKKSGVKILVYLAQLFPFPIIKTKR